MYAERVLLETDTSGEVKDIPILPPNSRVEAIFLVSPAPESPGTTVGGRRPHPNIAGVVTIFGDIASSLPEADWDLPR